MSARTNEGDPCGDGPIHCPTPEETFAKEIEAANESWMNSGVGGAH
jgi:hypothetical protein